METRYIAMPPCASLPSIILLLFWTSSCLRILMEIIEIGKCPTKLIKSFNFVVRIRTIP
jgi:hypothetical protein